MNKTLINFWLDFLLLILFCLLSWVSVVLRFVFPVGPVAFERTLWGMNFDQWNSIQFIVLCVFATGILLHVMLHWSWVMGLIRKRFVRSGKTPEKSLDTIYGVVLLIVLLHLIGGAYLIALFSIKEIDPVSANIAVSWVQWMRIGL